MNESHKRHDFRRNVTGHKMCVLISSTISYETFLIPRRNERDMIKNVTWYSCKVRVIIVRFKYGLNFLDRFSEKYPDIKFNENPPSGRRGVQCERTDGRTDGRTDRHTDRHDEGNGRFSQFCDRE